MLKTNHGECWSLDIMRSVEVSPQALLDLYTTGSLFWVQSRAFYNSKSLVQSSRFELGVRRLIRVQRSGSLSLFEEHGIDSILDQQHWLNIGPPSETVSRYSANAAWALGEAVQRSILGTVLGGATTLFWCGRVGARTGLHVTQDKWLPPEDGWECMDRGRRMYGQG